MFLYKNNIEDLKDCNIFHYKPYNYTQKVFNTNRKKIPAIRFICKNNETIEYYNGQFIINGIVLDGIDTIGKLYDYLIEYTKITPLLTHKLLRNIPTTFIVEFNNLKTSKLDGNESPIRYNRRIMKESINFLGLDSKITNVFGYNRNNNKSEDIDNVTDGLLFFKPSSNLDVYITEKYNDFVAFITFDNVNILDGYSVAELLSYTRGNS